MSDPGVPFDDADPEDAWSGDDPLIDQFDNAVTRLRHLLDGRSARVARLFEDLAEIRRRIFRRDF